MLYLHESKKNGFTAMLTDVIMEEESDFGMYDFFNYKDTVTSHNVEIKAVYQLHGKVPLQFIAGTYVFGSNRNASGRSYYSTWFEVG
jgi:hypothetical protein